MTDSKPKEIGELPLAREDLSKYNKYTVIGRDNGEFATVLPISNLSNDVVIPGYNELLCYDISLHYKLDKWSSSNNTIICKSFVDQSSITIENYDVVSQNMATLLQIKTINVNGTRTIFFPSGSVYVTPEDTTEYTQTTLLQNDNLKMLRMNFGTGYFYIRLRRAI